MIQNSKGKPYDLEERTFQLAKEVRLFLVSFKKVTA